jgi:hypothetical protein
LPPRLVQNDIVLWTSKLWQRVIGCFKPHIFDEEIRDGKPFPQVENNLISTEQKRSFLVAQQWGRRQGPQGLITVEMAFFINNDAQQLTSV